LPRRLLLSRNYKTFRASLPKLGVAVDRPAGSIELLLPNVSDAAAEVEVGIIKRLWEYRWSGFLLSSGKLIRHPNGLCLNYAA
jgi:hypothetical protein